MTRGHVGGMSPSDARWTRVGARLPHRGGTVDGVPPMIRRLLAVLVLAALVGGYFYLGCASRARTVTVSLRWAASARRAPPAKTEPRSASTALKPTANHKPFVVV